MDSNYVHSVASRVLLTSKSQKEKHSSTHNTSDISYVYLSHQIEAPIILQFNFTKNFIYLEDRGYR